MFISEEDCQFGSELFIFNLSFVQVEAEVVIAQPLSGCSSLLNAPSMKGKVVAVLRGDCMFQEKARTAQQAGALGVIVIGKQLLVP